MWWAVSTMTTVGYGDRFPITTEGRVAAIILMAAGVGVFGTVSGLVASRFLSPLVAEVARLWPRGVSENGSSVDPETLPMSAILSARGSTSW